MPPPPLDPATVHQQTELLQYTCLYSNSHAAYAQLTASATAKLKRRFDVLAKEHSRSREQLARRQRTHDLTGLAAVIETPSAGIVTGKRRETIRSPEEKIQAFSEAIKKLEALQQNEHRVLAAEFGEWIAGYSPPSPGGGMDKKGWVSRRGRWIDGLGEDWRRQVLFISRRIEGCVQAIESIIAAVVMAEEAGVIAVVSERWMEVQGAVGRVPRDAAGGAECGEQGEINTRRCGCWCCGKGRPGGAGRGGCVDALVIAFPSEVCA